MQCEANGKMQLARQEVFASLGAERVLINSLDIGYLPGLDHTRPRYTTALETGIIFDQRNNRLFPSAGYFLEARAEFATPALGAEFLPEAEAGLKKAIGSLGWAEGARALDAAAGVNSFQRYTLNGRFYLNLDEVLPIRGIVAKAMQDKQVTSRDLVELYLARIEAYDQPVRVRWASLQRARPRLAPGASR